MSNGLRSGFLGREPILTPDGPVPIHELRAGDLVLGRDVSRANDAGPTTLRILETHVLADTPIQAIPVGNYADPSQHVDLLFGSRQAFWVPDDRTWTLDFSAGAEFESADGGRRVGWYDEMRFCGPLLPGMTAWRETEGGAPIGDAYELDELGVIAVRRQGAWPGFDDGDPPDLRWPTHQLTLDQAHGFYATSEGILAHDFTFPADVGSAGLPVPLA